MSFEQKNIYVSLFSGTLVFAIYFWRVSAMFADGRFDAADASSLIGKSILLLMAGGIALHIAATFLFNILYAIAANEPDQSFLVDERDRDFELRALRIAYHSFGAGYVISMIALALGYTPFVVFNLIIFSCFVSTTAEGLARLFFYRRGY